MLVVDLMVVSNCIFACIFIFNHSLFRLAVLLACLENGNACMRSIPIRDKQQDLNIGSPMTWSVCSAGKILCSSVDKSGNYALFGG